MYPHPVTKKGPQVSQQWLETPRVPRLRSSRIHEADTNARSSDDIMRRSRIITPIAVLPLLLTLAVRDGKRMEFAGRHTMSEAPSFMKKVMFLRKDEKWATFCMPKFENLPTLANFPVWRQILRSTGNKTEMSRHVQAFASIALLGTSPSVVYRSARDSNPAGSLQATRVRAEPAIPRIFEKDFTRPMSIPEEGIDAAVNICRNGRLFRYSSESAGDSQVALAEKEFADMTQARYAVGVNSCSSAILIALLGVGVERGDKVLTNAFTFTAITSTLLRLGADPILVECCDSWTMNLDDLDVKAARSGAKFLLLSHMRGKVCDMERVVEICERRGITLVEDCAHTCGVMWRGRQLGYHGKVAAYSTQSDKVINSGEGGFITTSDDDIAARAIFLSGAYEQRYSKHLLRPSDALCEAYMLTVPNLSVRMSEITAAVLRPLLKNLPERVIEYNRRYQLVVETIEAEAEGLIEVPQQDERVGTVGDHLNFRLVRPSDEENLTFRTKCRELGVPVSWLRSSINARWHVNWRGFGGPVQDLPATDRALAAAYDLKLPPHFNDKDLTHVGQIIAYAARVAIERY